MLSGCAMVRMPGIRMPGSGIELGQRGYGLAGESGTHGSWILLDYGSVVVHVFLKQERMFYDLEGRWSEAKVVFDSNVTAPNRQAR